MEVYSNDENGENYNGKITGKEEIEAIWSEFDKLNSLLLGNSNRSISIKPKEKNKNLKSCNVSANYGMNHGAILDELKNKFGEMNLYKIKKYSRKIGKKPKNRWRMIAWLKNPIFNLEVLIFL